MADQRKSTSYVCLLCVLMLHCAGASAAKTNPVEPPRRAALMHMDLASLKKLATGDYTDVQIVLGERYLKGIGCTKDPAAAAAIWKVAADHGSAEAATQLGNLYESEALGPPNFAEAMKWYGMASSSATAKTVPSPTPSAYAATLNSSSAELMLQKAAKDAASTGKAASEAAAHSSSGNEKAQQATIQQQQHSAPAKATLEGEKAVVASTRVRDASEVTDQQAATYSGMPSIKYQGPSGELFYASLTEYQGQKAIVYEIGFEPFSRHKKRNLAVFAAAMGAAVATGAAGGTDPSAATEIYEKGTDAPAPLFGKLYLTEDLVAFVPSDSTQTQFAWSMKRSSFSTNRASMGLVIQASDQKDKSLASGLVHFRHLEYTADSYDPASEAKCLHKKQLAPGVQAFIDDFQASMDRFASQYVKMASKLGI